MIATYLEKAISHIPGLKKAGIALSDSLHSAVLGGGYPARQVADFLHGVWLGHPLHPVLTDIPIGSWTISALFDGVSVVTGSRDAEKIADTLLTVGIVAAVPTAITGMADYSTAPEPALADATVHGLLNSTALVLYLVSRRDRQQGRRGRAIVLSTLAFGISGFSAWLGGEMVYHQRVGVNHNGRVTKPEEWVAVLEARELTEGQHRRVEVEGQPVLLYRYGGTVYAIGARCAHAGGPLDEGTFDGFCVQCPWHDSVFDMRDGSIKHGPSTYPQPNYGARIINDKIEVRLTRPEEAL